MFSFFKQKPHPHAVAALVLTSIIWGITIPLLKVNLETVPPFILAFSRFAIAAAIGAIFLGISGLGVKDFLKIGLVSFVGVTLHISLLFLGLKETTAINASFISLLGPLVTSILAIFAIGETIRTSHLIGIGLAFFGTFIYIFYPIIFGDISFSGNLTGNLLVFGSSICASIYIIGSKKLFEQYHPSKIAAVTFITGMISFAPLAAWEAFSNQNFLNQITSFNLASIIFLGLASSFGAYLIYEWALERIPAHIDATISYLIPAISIAIAALFLNETLEPIFGFSLLFIAAGIFIVTHFNPKIHTHIRRHHHKT